MVLIYFTPNRNGYGTIFINIQNGYHTSIELKDLWQTSKEKRKLFPFHPIKKRSTLCLKQIFIQKKKWKNGWVQEDQISKENNPPMEKRCHSQELELTYMKRYKSINSIHLILYFYNSWKYELSTKIINVIFLRYLNITPKNNGISIQKNLMRPF